MKTCLFKSTFIEEPLLTIFEFRGKIKKMKIQAKPVVLFEKRGNWKEESGDVAKKSCLSKEGEGKRVVSTLASAEKNYIRILFVIKSLENIKRNFVTKEEICPSPFCARPEKNRLTRQLILNSQS